MEYFNGGDARDTPKKRKNRSTTKWREQKLGVCVYMRQGNGPESSHVYIEITRIFADLKYFPTNVLESVVLEHILESNIFVDGRGKLKGHVQRRIVRRRFRKRRARKWKWFERRTSPTTASLRIWDHDRNWKHSFPSLI